MSDPLYDDVKELLDKELGDERILKQIMRACENNEVISNYERNYVRKLAEKHLGRRPESKKIPVEQSKPDVILPETTSSPEPQILQTKPPKITTSNSKNSKMMIGIGGAALAIIIIIAAAFSGISDMPSDTNISDSVDTPSVSFSVETDSNSYQQKDIISINGKSDTSGTVNLSIENQDGELVWSEQVKTKSDGKFSTLTIAGGPGWETSGTFTLKAQNDSETQTKTFSFKV